MEVLFDHVDIRVSDLAASRRFYTEALGLPDLDGEWLEWGDFGIVGAESEQEVTRGLHVGFGGASRDAVDAWWNRLTEAGYESDGEPGPRPQYSDDYYGAFVLDPDGNSIELVHHGRAIEREMDHLWLRTRDLAGERDFYATVAEVVAVSLAHDDGERVTFRFDGGHGSFTFVPGDEPTRNAHLAFGVADFATVERFHEVAVGAGYLDNGAPGERPQYHPGYYGAFVLDPDGHNVEAVFHDRRER